MKGTVPAIAPVVPAPVVAVGARPAVEPPRSWVDGFIERTRASIAAATPVSPTAYTHAGLTTLGTFVTAGITGSLLGATHATWGLDTRIGAVDGWIAGLGAALGVALSGHMPEVAAHARAIGSQAFTVLTFRKGYEVVRHEGIGGGARVQHIAAPGSGRPDPIEEVAKTLS